MYNQSAKTLFQPQVDRKLFVSFGLMSFAVLTAIFILIANSGAFESFPYLFLLPWLLLLAVIMLTPVAFVAMKGSDGFANPLMIATLTYLFPAFVLGGISLSVGLSTPYFLSFVQDTTETFTYSVILVILGFTGLAAGYYLPLGRKVGAYVSNLLPRSGLSADSYIISGLLLVFLGVFNTTYATVVGVVGFQRMDSIGIFDGLIFLSTLFLLQGRFLLWSVIFRAERIGPKHWALIILLVGISLGTAALAGNRGSLLSSTIVVGIAYLLSGRKLTVRMTILASFLAMLAILAGMIYGTKFREGLGSQAKTDFGTYTENIGSAIQGIAKGDNLQNLEYGFVNFAERLDILSTLAVVVSNYEQLAPYEEGYGLDNNIVKDTATLLVPRVIWPEKPVASDPRAYSELYFAYGENSFAITPIGDLLRNFGPTGVFFGMMLLGLVLRSIYRAFVENQPDVLWRKTLYFMLVTSVSFEAFYGSILPMLVKVGITSVVGILLTELVARRFSGRSSITPQPAR